MNSPHRYEEDYPQYNYGKSGQWFLLNRAHAELAIQHADDALLSMPDEWYLATLLKTYHRKDETTCDWQGPTYTNWTVGDTDHPLTYRAVDADQLRRMRLGSTVAAECDWEAALAQAASPGRFVDITTWEVHEEPAAFVPMDTFVPMATAHSSCARWRPRRRPATRPRCGLSLQLCRLRQMSKRPGVKRENPLCDAPLA